MTGEFAQKPQADPVLFQAWVAQPSLKSKKFPVFSLFIREINLWRRVRIRLRYPPASPSPDADWSQNVEIRAHTAYFAALVAAEKA
jgi:hypothetical protein